MHVARLVICVALTAVALSACGSSEPPPFTGVQQPATTSTSAPPAAATVPSVETRVTKLSPSEGRALAQLLNARDALAQQAQAVTTAAAGAQALADRVSAGYTAPSGSVQQIARLRDALTAFSNALSSMSTTSALPQLSAQLQVRSERLAKKRPAAAARLLTAKQGVDAAIGEVATLQSALQVAGGKVRDQLAKVTLDANDLSSAIASGTESTSAALAKVNNAVDNGLAALAAAS